MAHPGGRPTKYDPKYIDQLYEYFDVEPDYDTPITRTKNGVVEERMVSRPSRLPTLAGFAKQIKVDRDTIKEWAKKHEEFSAAIRFAKECQEAILVTNALLGSYDSRFSIFFAQNNLDWKNRSDVTSKDERISDAELDRIIED